MGSVAEPGQLVDDDELAGLEDLVVQEPAAVGEHDGTEVVPCDHREGGAGRGRVGAQEGDDAGDEALELWGSVAELALNVRVKTNLVGRARRRPPPR
jgi:hypothetical protein